MIYLALSVCLLLILVISLYFQLSKKVKELEQIKAKFNSLQLEVEPIQLENLQAKLNPHLFKNVLNSIQSHAFQTYQSLDKLANVLDYILYESNRGPVTPEQEIQFALNLIEINKVKLSPLFELQVKVKIEEDEGYHQKSIAPMILVDLIENAFKHTDLQSQDSFIRIHLAWNQGTLSLLVSNKVSQKSPIKKPQSGIGSHTLEQRLEILQPGRHSLKRYTEEDKFIAHLILQPHGKNS